MTSQSWLRPSAGPQKITFADMRDMGVRGLLIFAPITSAAT
jgi:hypothetical protein